eukprot:CAMPEP_0168204566 /NCGR_PEP_ID=MMETSP0139_2-20121125/25463_1 /TAXON_ID=44445 /ORGANISM="Pseudo-nitzschia australis, Strain 10249 10 AB" /LENGTH=157 /DNA_ID=CAMNT_0008130507 /DNA_START=99 /DNA_END=572 /DNA_ORIENTATION=-
MVSDGIGCPAATAQEATLQPRTKVCVFWFVFHNVAFEARCYVRRLVPKWRQFYGDNLRSGHQILLFGCFVFLHAVFFQFLCFRRDLKILQDIVVVHAGRGGFSDRRKDRVYTGIVKALCLDPNGGVVPIERQGVQDHEFELGVIPVFVSFGSDQHAL